MEALFDTKTYLYRLARALTLTTLSRSHSAVSLSHFTEVSVKEMMEAVIANYGTLTVVGGVCHKRL